MVVAYFRQQTLVPLQQLGRYVGFGILGSLLLGFGVSSSRCRRLRALQDETGDTFTGDWSWVPYLIMFVVAADRSGTRVAGARDSRVPRRSTDERSEVDPPR